MPAGFYTPSSEVENVVGIQICVFSPQEVERRSVVEITNAGTYDGTEPKIGGLFDPRMGVLDNGKECRSCGQTNHKCPGHFGHFRLARPVYYIQFLPYILNVLSCVCIRCSKLLMDKKQKKHLLKKSGEARFREVVATCKDIKRCGGMTEDGCGAMQPSRYTKEGIARIMASWAAIEGPDVVLPTGDSLPTTNHTQLLEVEYVLRLFRRISDEDVDFMGFNRYWCRPDWMICTVLPIPPPQVRPSVIQDNNQRAEDDLTHKLAEIIKTNNSYLQPRIEAGAAKSVIDEWTNVLQYHIATLVDNQIPGVAPSAQRNGRPLKSIQQRLGSKEGRIRFNIQGKRVEFSARSVITPDPNISIAELGVPEKIAMNLTRPERVTRFNRDRLYKYIRNGPNKHPGAKTIRKADGRIVSLKHINTDEVVLEMGDLVNRHLMDGDIVLFNRQPTLHRMSMMGHRVKVLKGKTFRLNVSVTAPYNADFDGDEMNMHCPQSYEAATELEEIAAVPRQIIAPRDGLPVIGIVQDTLVGSYRLTRPNVTFNRKEFMNLMMWNKRFEGELPTPKGAGGRFTGHQILSELLPPVNMEMNNKAKQKVVIREGQLLEGQVDKHIYSASSQGIIHMTYNDYGPTTTVELIDALQNTIEQFLIYNGFSVGISDLIADSGTKETMGKTIREKKADVESIALQLHQDIFDNNTGKSNQAEFEDKIFGLLNKALETAGDAGQGSLANENRMTAMVRAGSKGGPINIAQMIACVGQQNIEGKRIPYGFEDRTLPHYKKYDDSAEARGFVENSFISGLSPTEFFFHAMSGREGLIDTAVKTADTGYIQRQLVKAMEDLVVQHDGTVRDANQNIVQFHYGEDGINSTKIESQEIGLDKLSDKEISEQFGLEGADLTAVLGEGVDRGEDAEALATYVEQIKEDRKMLVEGVYKSRKPVKIYAAVNLERLLMGIKIKFGLAPDQRTNLTPARVLAGIQGVLDKTQKFHRIWAALLRFHLSPMRMIVKERLTETAFDTLCELLVLRNWQAWVQPGEQVGIIAAQSIGEPSTQMTLNTFHLAGVASKSNVTRGVPRLKELLKVTQNPKAVSLTIPLKREYSLNKIKAREVTQELELTLLRDMTTKAAIYYDPEDSTTVLKEDRELIAFYRLFDAVAEEGVTNAWSRWILRVELDRQKMFDKNITMDDILYVLRDRFGDDVALIYSDFNSQKLIMRIRLSKAGAAAQEGKTDPSSLDDMNAYKKFLNKVMNTVTIRGLPGIKAVTFRKGDPIFSFNTEEGKYESKEEYILDTDGSNFMEVCCHPAVDSSRVYSTHVHDILTYMGVEAARAVLFNEINTLFEDGKINYRHLGLLTDVMTRAGRLMSADRYGINKLDIGPLAKASFEETERILLKAAVFGEIDPVTGVSANIMAGQTIRGGTAFSDVLLDEVAVLRLQQGLPPLQGEEVDEGPTDEQIEEELGMNPADLCSPARLRMTLSLPKAGALLEDEPDVELFVDTGDMEAVDG